MFTLEANLTPKFSPDIENQIITCDGFSLLGGARPTGNWGLDNRIGQQALVEAISLDIEKGNHGFYTQAMLLEFCLFGIDWRGIQVGAFSQAAEILVRRRR